MTLWKDSLCEGRQSEFASCDDLPECDDCEPENCKFSPWVEWTEGSCDGLCERRRGFKKNNECGEPCEGVTIDSKAGSGCYDCIDSADKEQPSSGPGNGTKDDDDSRCSWSDWGDWGECSAECSGGHHTRTRDLSVPTCSTCDTPLATDDICEARSKKEIEPCNTQPCEGDCKWKEWSLWSVCSSTCDGGLKKRRREVLGASRAKLHNATCLHPPVGLVEELQPCNVDVPCPEKNPDCKFSDWEDWSDCSCSCDGISKRARVIKELGRGSGAKCAGQTQEIMQCNPIIGDDRPSGCNPMEPVDCKLSDWRKWSNCSAPCGGGQKSRSRHLKTLPQAGGHPCDEHLAETVGCNLVPCKIDCKWTDWSSWSACEKCGGERKRFRHISQMPRHGGMPCATGASEEQDKCDRVCHQRSFCAWGDWEDFRQCSMTCGTGGHRERGRALRLVHAVPGAFVQDFDAGLKHQVEELRVQTRSHETRRICELTAAFGFGIVSLFAVVRLSRTLWPDTVA